MRLAARTANGRLCYAFQCIGLFLPGAGKTNARHMRIGILTQPLRANYGGLLQCWALQQVLLRLGHEAWVIRREEPDVSHRLTGWLRRQTANMVKAATGRTGVKWVYRGEERRIFEYVRRFSRTRIQPQTPPLHSSAALLADYEERRYDAYVVGSDQVWRPSFIDSVTDYFLGFLPSREKVRRVAYAASFGTDEWEFGGTLAERCRRLAVRFDAVSVRERGGVALCRERLGIDARWVLDPTLLLLPADYEALARDEAAHLLASGRLGGVAVPASGEDSVPARPAERVVTDAFGRSLVGAGEGGDCCGRLFCYVIDRSDSAEALCREVGMRLGLTPVSVLARAEGTVPRGTPTSDMVHPPVSAWLTALREADAVLTDSFHGCVFALLFGRPFVTLGNAVRGQARFSSLLSLFGLECRMVGGADAAAVANRMSEPIDWRSVNEILCRERERSVDFLRQTLIES